MRLFFSFCIFIIYVSAAVIRDNPFNKSHKFQLLKKAKEILYKPENQKISCFECSLIVDGVQTLIKQNSTEEDISNFIIETCEFLGIEEDFICQNMVPIFLDEILFVMAHSLFTPEEICGGFIPNCGTSVNPFDVMWPLSIPGNKPPVKPWPTIPPNNSTYRFLHLSDIHIDRQYTIGTEAYCQADSALTFDAFSLCCRNYTESNGKKKPIYVPAGPWGTSMICDLPFQTFDAALRHISQTHTDLDYIIITGDFEAHDPWDYTIDLTRANIENITATLLKYFPTIPIYVSVGNHEGVPQDSMGPHTMPDYDTRGPQPVYTILKNMFSNWIPASELPNVQYRASYSMYIKPGLKLISLNTIYCSSFNFYLYMDQRDPDATLQWLIEQLADSESKSEKVHIISHIPPGSNYCLKGFSWNFFEIVKRYEGTIASLFMGHTHNDHFQVYYDNATGRPFHFNWITPSLTTNSWNNPAYRIYTIDGGYNGASYTVKEAETYTTDLTEANKKNQEPVYTLEYKYTEFYGMKDLSPQSFGDLSDRLWTDKNLFRQFVKFYYRNSFDNECWTDEKCQRNYVCFLKQGRSHDETFCPQLN